MSRSETFEIPYRLIADPNTPEVSPLGTGQADSQDTPRTITVPVTHTIYDLYTELIQTLRDTHRFITIQFPCIVPTPYPNGELQEESQNPFHTGSPPEWKDLVGYSGYRYDPSLKIEYLISCWPRQIHDTKLKPMQVVAIPKVRVETPLHPADETPLHPADETPLHPADETPLHPADETPLHPADETPLHPADETPLHPADETPLHPADETEEQLKERLHLMGSMYDLFYTYRKDRVIWMSTLDSKFETRKEVWIRSCWEEFQIGVIAHFLRFSAATSFAHPDLKILENYHYADKCPRPVAGDEALWRSIKGTPEWIYFDNIHPSPFRQLVSSSLKGNDCCKAFYVNGQPGTGKSQMLLYLIYCLMTKVYKVAILYILPHMPVITILVDYLNYSNPISIRSHASSLGEDMYTRGFPVIRIVDSVDPFANKAMQDVFTVYAASPTKYEIQFREPDHEKHEWRENYPLWREGEFYTMMRCLKMTERERWIRPVDADIIVKLHPLVITLLGTHGYLEDESDSSDDQLGFLQFTAMDGSTLKRSHPRLPFEMLLYLNVHFPNDNMSVNLNVIEVFGLSPRALSADLNKTFKRMSEVFGWGGITLEGVKANLVISSLTASHLGYRPVSEFASRLLLAMNRIEAEGFLKNVRDETIPGAFRRYILEHKVNRELLRSHTRFTLYSTTPDLFPTSNCTFPVIDRCALRSSQLDDIQYFKSNVLYCDSLIGSEMEQEQKSWTGINFFIFFHDKDSIKLFTFHTAVNSNDAVLNYRLIEKVKNVLEIQHSREITTQLPKHTSRSMNQETTIEIGKEMVEVFFIQIVRPEDVLPYIPRNKVFRDHEKKASSGYGSYRTGVVSISDLLFNEYSGWEGPVTKRPKIEKQWTTDDVDFRKCFVMKEQTVDPRRPQGILMQPVLRPETTPEPVSVPIVDPHHPQGMKIQPFDSSSTVQFQVCRHLSPDSYQMQDSAQSTIIPMAIGSNNNVQIEMRCELSENKRELWMIWLLEGNDLTLLTSRLPRMDGIWSRVKPKKVRTYFTAQTAADFLSNTLTPHNWGGNTDHEDCSRLVPTLTEVLTEPQHETAVVT
ncbi:hypothetical protein BLNAU_13790 [Blattamonas nauphoetae]|uniref:Uncharacterized protein n=1 Tax=Blattamonas nauphoetae TaxID=2049346 RepID=A0ABQ9XJ01_9EUKA|nr:hypothetical protein BLNAU_13790 [Blattamonas nauphoetae]